MIIVIETPFVSTLVHTIVNIRSRPQTPRGTKLMSLHKVFVNQPSNPKGSGSNPPGPPGLLGCFGLPVVNLGKPTLPPNKPYH
jgi:hypothetical protein